MKRIVIKIGSSSLASPGGGLARSVLDNYVDAVAALHKLGHELLVVSSGAVSSGFGVIGYGKRPTTTIGKQASAAVGQGLLIHSYTESFARYGVTVGQVLLARRDFSDREAYNNAYACLTELVTRRVIPIINENDTVATQELRFGDNDTLSALVSALLKADLLLILTDTDGVYDADPRTSPGAKRFEELREVTPELLALMGSGGSGLGTGGMKSKVMAASRALSLGVEVFIGQGHNLPETLEGRGNGTYFRPTVSGATLSKKRQWIAFHGSASGSISIDDGAVQALLKGGRSLLPAGVTALTGDFAEGDIIEIYGEAGSKFLGRGVSQHKAAALRELIGTRNRAEKQIEVVHRDNWVNLYDESAD